MYFICKRTLNFNDHAANPSHPKKKKLPCTERTCRYGSKLVYVCVCVCFYVGSNDIKSLILARFSAVIKKDFKSSLRTWSAECWSVLYDRKFIALLEGFYRIERKQNRAYKCIYIGKPLRRDIINYRSGNPSTTNRIK